MNTQSRTVEFHDHALLNTLIDRYCPNTRGGEFKLLLCIYRHTLSEVSRLKLISLTDFMRITGLSKNTVIAGLRSLEEKQLIKRTEHQHATLYEINMAVFYPKGEVPEDVESITYRRTSSVQDFPPLKYTELK